jgi:hypothetical protein
LCDGAAAAADDDDNDDDDQSDEEDDDEEAEKDGDANDDNDEEEEEEEDDAADRVPSVGSGSCSGRPSVSCAASRPASTSSKRCAPRLSLDRGFLVPVVSCVSFP